MNDDSEQPYKITGWKVWLSATAREHARQYGMTDVEFAKYLMNRQRLGEAGVDVSAITEEEPTDDPEIP